MPLPDPKHFASQAFKKAARSALKAEAKSWLLFLILLAVPTSAAVFIFGVKALLWLSLILGMAAALLLITFTVQMIVNKDLRKSFLDYRAMDDE